MQSQYKLPTDNVSNIYNNKFVIDWPIHIIGWKVTNYFIFCITDSAVNLLFIHLEEDAGIEAL